MHNIIDTVVDGFKLIGTLFGAITFRRYMDI